MRSFFIIIIIIIFFFFFFRVLCLIFAFGGSSLVIGSPRCGKGSRLLCFSSVRHVCTVRRNLCTFPLGIIGRLYSVTMALPIKKTHLFKCIENFTTKN